MSPQFLSLIDVGVDAFTATVRDSKGARIIQDKAAILLMQEHAAGNQKKFFGSYGYEGFKCGGVSFGSRHDGTMIRLTGPTAYMHWKKFMPFASNVSRIDLQATLRWDQPSARMLAKHYRASKRLYDLGKLQRQVNILKSTNGSATIYYGVRESERFGRVYQKDHESKLDHYQNALRYEIEIKGDLALRTAKSLHTRSSEKELCYQTVTRYYGQAGIRMPELSDRQLALTSASRTLSDRESRRRWLISSVKPAVKRLVDNGDLAMVLDSLGLSDLVLTRGQLIDRHLDEQEDTIQ